MDILEVSDSCDEVDVLSRFSIGSLLIATAVFPHLVHC